MKSEFLLLKFSLLVGILDLLPEDDEKNKLLNDIKTSSPLCYSLICLYNKKSDKEKLKFFDDVLDFYKECE